MTSVFGLSSQGVVGWISLASATLSSQAGVLNLANVFPVADSDTGTNMALTMASSADAARLEADNGGSAQTVLAAAGRGALLGARGNSGVILAEFFTGFAQGCLNFVDEAEVDPISKNGAQLFAALDRAQASASSAVALPVAGTILTAAQYGAQAAGDALRVGIENSPISENLVTLVAHGALDGAVGALNISSQQLAVLARSQVLDAGAYGLVLVLGALAQTLGGRTVTESVRLDLKSPNVVDQRTILDLHEEFDKHGEFDIHSDVDGEFEVMMLVRAQNALGNGGTVLRKGLQELGESVVVVGGVLSAHEEGLWQCHVHTDVPEQVLRLVCGSAQSKAILAGADVGQVVIRSLSRQVQQLGAGQDSQIGLVACTDSPGIAVDLARSGAVVVVKGTRGISAADVERAALEFPAPPIIVTNALAITGRAQEKFEHVVAGLDDIHVVAAVGAINQEVSNVGLLGTQDIRPTDLVRTAEKVVAAVKYVLLEPRDNTDLIEALDNLFARPGAPGTVPVLTALVDQEFPTRFLHDLIAGIEHRNPDAEIITLTSGKLGTAATLCLEWM